MKKCILIAILCIAFFFRFSDINWDQGQHLHPDERFLTMVATDMKLPRSLGDYLDPSLSTFNPANTGHAFFVYGTFPIVASKLLAIAVNGDNYGDITLLGRIVSAFVDLFVVYLLYKTLFLLEKKYQLPKNTKYWGAFFYAIAVLPIQLSHFFAVDTFLNAFVFASFYYTLRFSMTKKRWRVVLSALFFGLAIGSKVTAVFILPVLVVFMVNAYMEKKQILRKHISELTITFLLFGFIAYCVGRLADPYLFQSSDFFDLRPSSLLLSNLKQLQAWGDPKGWFPPNVQWIHKTPILFSLQNIVIFGVGIGFTFFIVAGISVSLKRYRSTALSIVLGWMGLFFLYQSLQTSTTMRYFIILYPFFSLFAALGWTFLTQRWHILFKIIALSLILIWPLFFYSIYTKNHSRVTASQWMQEMIPSESIILYEGWDDALPLSLGPTQKTYLFEQLPVFDPDSVEKWQKMDTVLAKGDYISLSSNRGWGSIPTVPERYPRMTQFYHDLFAGRTAYKHIATFTSYPSLEYLGIPIAFPDDWAEEAFTVYDHPKVMLFQKKR